MSISRILTPYRSSNRYGSSGFKDQLDSLTFLDYFALDVTANCICEIHSIALDGFDLNTAHKLSSYETQAGWDSNSGLLGGMQECYLCATQPPSRPWHDNLGTTACFEHISLEPQSMQSILTSLMSAENMEFFHRNNGEEQVLKSEPL